MVTPFSWLYEFFSFSSILIKKNKNLHLETSLAVQEKPLPPLSPFLLFQDFENFLSLLERDMNIIIGVLPRVGGFWRRVQPIKALGKPPVKPSVFPLSASNPPNSLSKVSVVLFP